MRSPSKGIRVALAAVFALPGVAVPQQATAQSAACGTAEHRQFDFWLGDWDAFSPDGKLAGWSHIEKVLDGCVIREEYSAPVDPPPYRGESLSVYDARNRRWSQTWVDTAGVHVRLDGGLRDDGKLVLEGTAGMGPPGRLTRMIWTVEGEQLRQRIERSDDQGATWALAFELIYKRKR